MSKLTGMQVESFASNLTIMTWGTASGRYYALGKHLSYVRMVAL